jgi:hypothetical protein
VRQRVWRCHWCKKTFRSQGWQTRHFWYKLCPKQPPPEEVRRRMFGQLQRIAQRAYRNAQRSVPDPQPLFAALVRGRCLVGGTTMEYTPRATRLRRLHESGGA